MMTEPSPVPVGIVVWRWGVFAAGAHLAIEGQTVRVSQYQDWSARWVWSVCGVIVFAEAVADEHLDKCDRCTVWLVRHSAGPVDPWPQDDEKPPTPSD